MDSFVFTSERLSINRGNFPFSWGDWERRVNTSVLFQLSCSLLRWTFALCSNKNWIKVCAARSTDAFRRAHAHSAYRLLSETTSWQCAKAHQVTIKLKNTTLCTSRSLNCLAARGMNDVMVRFRGCAREEIVAKSSETKVCYIVCVCGCVVVLLLARETNTLLAMALYMSLSASARLLQRLELNASSFNPTFTILRKRYENWRTKNTFQNLRLFEEWTDFIANLDWTLIVRNLATKLGQNDRFVNAANTIVSFVIQVTTSKTWVD